MGDLNANMYYAGLCFTLVIAGVSGLLKPSYVSTWHYVDVNDPSTAETYFYHGFGHLPEKVEVQVRSPTGFIYSGTVSTYNDGSLSVHAGVTVMYSTSSIRMVAASMGGTSGGQPYVVYTGLASWTQDDQEYLTAAYIRVRAWDTGDLPTPTLSENLIYMNAGDDTTNYKEILHASGVVPELTVVQYRYSNPSYPFYMEAQGTSSHVETVSSLEWGGIVFAVDENYIRLWAPSSGAPGIYGLYNACHGWGTGGYTSCRIHQGELIVKVYQNLESAEIFSQTDTHSVSDSGIVPHDYTIPINFNVDEDLVIVESIAVDGYNSGYHFQAAMAATFDDAYSLAGLVYAYSSTGNVRVWHPTTSNSYIVRVGPGMGNVPAYEQYSNYVNMTIKIWRGLNCPTLAVSGLSSNVAQVSATISQITYQCLPNTELTTGDLVRLCQINDTWSGSTPDCAWCEELEVGMNVVLDTDTLIQSRIATFSCTPGYSLVSGNLSRVCGETSSGKGWSGSPAVCSASNTIVDVCPYPESGINSEVTVSALLSGSIATYNCMGGYTLLTGSLSRMCGGTPLAWDGNRTECAVLCTNPGIASGASYVTANNDPVTGALVLGTTASYSCNAGLQHSAGDLVRVCYGTGTWTGNAPTCNAVTHYCPYPPAGVNVNLGLTTISEGSAVTYTCLPGYSHMSGSASLLCVHDNLLNVTSWVGSASKCLATCDVPNVVANTSYVMSSATPFVVGTVVTYNCASGLELAAGDLVRVCYGVNLWTGVTPSCTAANSSSGSVVVSIRTAAAEEIARQLVINLTIPAKSTAKYQRSLISVFEHRTSAICMGAFGISICVGIVILAVAPDLIDVLRSVFCKSAHIPMKKDIK